MSAQGLLTGSCWWVGRK